MSILDTPWHYQTVTQLAAALRAGKTTSLELTEHMVARIEAVDGDLNAFRLQCFERAFADARAADCRLRVGEEANPLLGIPYAAKDLFDVAGLPTTAGARLMENNVASQDATVVTRLKDAGMVLLGKTNTVQFAYGGAGINHDHGTPHNPWQREHHVPGGSSSGSAVAVAAGMTPMGLGSDTGGSVRIPAALCGISGLKTTVGRVSRAGVYPLSWSLDSVGPLTRSIEDAALVYTCLQGADVSDATTAGQPKHDVLSTLKSGVRGLKLAFAECGAFWEQTDPETQDAVRACGEVFGDLGAEVSSIEFEVAEEARQLNRRGLIIAAEAWTLNRRWLEGSFDELDPVVAHRMIKGREISAEEYLHIAVEMLRLRTSAGRALEGVDALLVPTTAIVALPVNEVDADFESYSTRNLLYLRNTAIGNVLNLCGLSVPCGFTQKGLPVGLMIYSRAFCEELALQVGCAYQQATDWHLRAPDLSWVGDTVE